MLVAATRRRKRRGRRFRGPAPAFPPPSDYLAAGFSPHEAKAITASAVPAFVM